MGAPGGVGLGGGSPRAGPAGEEVPPRRRGRPGPARGHGERWQAGGADCRAAWRQLRAGQEPPGAEAGPGGDRRSPGGVGSDHTLRTALEESVGRESASPVTLL